ncbi:MAG: hypothetical protein KDC12_09510 [Flavobacteriales bacterium]|nr:hypothetical protein [Flavobacteriales bacterium]
MKIPLPIYIISWSVLLVTLLQGCTRVESREEYYSYLLNEENGLLFSTASQQVELKIIYTPPELVAWKSYPEEEICQVVEEYAEYVSFEMRLTPKSENTNLLLAGIGSGEEFAIRQKYLDFDLKNNLFLVSGLDTLVCTNYHKSRNYGLTPYQSIEFSFWGLPIGEGVKLILDDRLFNLGRNEFIIKKDALADLPKLCN